MYDLNIYFWITSFLITLNGFLFTHSVMKEKDEGWKTEIITGIISYVILIVLMYLMSVN